MFDDVDQHEATLAAGGSVVLPATLLETLRRRPGTKLLIEQTDEGVLITAPGDVE